MDDKRYYIRPCCYYNSDNDYLDISFDSYEEAVRFAMKEWRNYKDNECSELWDEYDLEHDDNPTFEIGIREDFEPSIDVEYVLERIDEDASEYLGEYYNDDYYFVNIKEEHMKELESMLNNALNEWIKKYGYNPSSYLIYPMVAGSIVRNGNLDKDGNIVEIELINSNNWK